ncbi:MAG: cysteine desulfurase family protein [bacterium]|nr:cysteine desulfurase family protein [bacterium]
MLFRRRRIYLDHASATPILESAVRAMRTAEKLIGNPGSIHDEGVQASRSLESSRARIVAVLACKPREIIFTSGITESNNLAILGMFKKLILGGSTAKHTHWITSSIEHASVLACFEHIKQMGGIVSFVHPDARGVVSAEAIQKELKKETVLVSIGWANNEIGVIQPLSEISRVIRGHEKKHGTAVALHSDAGQVPLYLPATVNSLGVDLFSLGAAKIYGPHGIGALCITGKAEPAPIILGGEQERGLRSGTENVALAAGFAEAFECIARERAGESKRLSLLRDMLARGLASGIPGVVTNGEPKHSLPHMLNVSVPGISGEYFVLSLDRAGIFISTKSACGEGTEKSSHVIAALGGEAWRAQNSLRFSLGRNTTERDIERVIKECVNIISTLAAANSHH